MLAMLDDALLIVSEYVCKPAARKYLGLPPNPCPVNLAGKRTKRYFVPLPPPRSRLLTSWRAISIWSSQFGHFRLLLQISSSVAVDLLKNHRSSFILLEMTAEYSVIRLERSP